MVQKEQKLLFLCFWISRNRSILVHTCPRPARRRSRQVLHLLSLSSTVIGTRKDKDGGFFHILTIQKERNVVGKIWVDGWLWGSKDSAGSLIRGRFKKKYKIIFSFGRSFPGDKSKQRFAVRSSCAS